MDTCDECGARFDPDQNLKAGRPFEFWCSNECQRAWQLRQVDGAGEVDMSGALEEAHERAKFAHQLMRWQLLN